MGAGWPPKNLYFRGFGAAVNHHSVAASKLLKCNYLPQDRTRTTVQTSKILQTAKQINRLVDIEKCSQTTTSYYWNNKWLHTMSHLCTVTENVFCSSRWILVYVFCNPTTTTTPPILRPFFPGLPGEPVPEETFTHSPILVIIQPYQLLPSTTIHSILRVQFIL